MPISSNNSHITFNNSSTQNTAFLGSIAAANITGQITAPQIAPGVIPSGGFVNMTVFTSTTPGQTFSVPPTTTRLKVTVVGGGGGGQGSGTPICHPTPKGGAGGGAAIRVICGLAGGNTIPVTVGAGGTAGTVLGGAGGAGGTSSFGVFSSATGGAGGSTPANYILGGTGCGGQLNIQGSSPSWGWKQGIACSCATIGVSGGASYLGGGGQAGFYPVTSPTSAASAGRAGGNYGGGGGSGSTYLTPSSGNAQAPGGVGAAGVVIVEW